MNDIDVNEIYAIFDCIYILSINPVNDNVDIKSRIRKYLMDIYFRIQSSRQTIRDKGKCMRNGLTEITKRNLTFIVKQKKHAKQLCGIGKDISRHIHTYAHIKTITVTME